jgi:hypothetical protein
MCELPETAELYLDGSRGQYIPQNFFEITKPECINWHDLDADKDAIKADCMELDSDFHHDCWTDVLDNVTLINPDTKVEYTLYQDGDLWIIPVNAEWPENEL